MNDKENIISRIKKLLRMKNGGTVAEIETALSLAQQLAHKHGIDINSINEHEPEREPITHEGSPGISRIQWECKYAALICSEFFNVKIFYRKFMQINIIFVGTKTNIEIARYIYTFLVRHFRREWNNKRGRLRNRRAFLYGMFLGLRKKLHQEKQQMNQQYGLVETGNIVRLEDYMKNNFSKMETQSVVPDNNAVAATTAGYLAGKQTNIHTGLNATSQTQKALA